jgi:hypothetical protein
MRVAVEDVVAVFVGSRESVLEKGEHSYMFLRTKMHQDCASTSNLAVAYHSGARGLKSCVPTEADMANTADNDEQQQEPSEGCVI